MKKLKLTLLNEHYIYPVVKVNGKAIHFKNSGRFKEANIETEDGIYTLQVGKFYELSQPKAVGRAIGFWFLGLGFFAPKYEKRCPSLNFETKFIVTEDQAEVNLSFMRFNEGQPAFEITSPTLMHLTTPSNIYTVDQVAQKRGKKYRIINFFARFALLVIIAVTAVLLLT